MHTERLPKYIVSHKTGLNKFKGIQVTQSILYQYNGIKLKINNLKIYGKFVSIWKLNNVLLNNLGQTISQKGN